MTKAVIETQEDLSNLVYVRLVNVDELPVKIQQQVEGMDVIYAVHREDGAPLALAKDRDVAFSVARENKLEPVYVH